MARSAGSSSTARTCFTNYLTTKERTVADNLAEAATISGQRSDRSPAMRHTLRYGISAAPPQYQHGRLSEAPANGASSRATRMAIEQASARPVGGGLGGHRRDDSRHRSGRSRRQRGGRADHACSRGHRDRSGEDPTRREAVSGPPLVAWGRRRLRLLPPAREGR